MNEEGRREKGMNLVDLPYALTVCKCAALCNEQVITFASCFNVQDCSEQIL